uniref:DUF641 domain-containing protein n=1 Tax=Populus alba TaxID=43335 RepID=A0A4U5Q8Y4_POPAL|nr:hypothetical protein D5086_0000121060 [Populus alba]
MRLSDLKQVYRDLCKNPDFGDDLPIGSCLEAQVEENQSKLRILGTVSNSLQTEIDQKDSEVSVLKKKLSEVQRFNSLSLRSCAGSLNLNFEVLLTVKVFDSVLNDACRTMHKFTKILVDLMKKLGFNLERVWFWRVRVKFLVTGLGLDSVKSNSSLKQLLEHVSSNPMELLSRNPTCEFSRFCEKKNIKELMHPAMESSIFSKLDQN